MSNTSYFVSLIQQMEVVKTSTLLSDEEREVFAAALLSEMKPEMMTRGSEEARAIVTDKLKKMRGSKGVKKNNETRSDPELLRQTPEDPIRTDAGKPHSDKPRGEEITSPEHDSVSDLLVQSRPAVQPSGRKNTKRKA